MHRSERGYEAVMLIMDSVGLGVFTVVGISAAFTVVEDPSVFLLLFVGAVTGVGGGVMRDIFAGNTPDVFVKHIYASASLVGAAVTIMIWPFAGSACSMLAGTAAVILIRLLSVHYRWNLPKAKEC